MASAASITLSWPTRAPVSLPVGAQIKPFKAGDENCVLIQGDNLSALSALRSWSRRRYALAYLDPPFFTGREHARVKRHKDSKSGRIVRRLVPAFDDRWQNLESYLNALSARLQLVHSLLQNDGCMVLHVDSKTSHYAKILCDEIFGPRSFASEIVWRYRRWPSRTRNFQRVHDVLLRYVKDPDKPVRFRQLYEPLASSTLTTWGDKRQRAIVDENGQRRRSSVTRDRTPGTPLGDVWDIGIVAPVARERTGYPTQKPEALIQRLLEACTNQGDWILDPYVGSGTTLAVARRLERCGVGIDQSPQAITTTQLRLREAGILGSVFRVQSGPKRANSRKARSKVA